MKLSLAIGQAIRNVRHENKMTLRQLQKKTHIAISHLSDIERGNKSTTPDYYEIISNAFGMDIEEFFYEVLQARDGKTVTK